MALRIVQAPLWSPPFPVDGWVEEEDSFLVLSAARVVVEPREHPLRLLQDLHETEPLSLGAVVVRPGPPWVLLAVVHDLSLDPSCDEGTVEQALVSVFRVVEEQGIRSLALPLLGSVHGVLEPERSRVLIEAALECSAPECLHHLWLITPE